MSVIRTLASTENPLFSQASMSAAAAASRRRDRLAQALAGDGSVQFVAESTDTRILAAAMTRAKGELPAAPWSAE